MSSSACSWAAGKSLRHASVRCTCWRSSASPQQAALYPYQLSGGMKHRVAVARAWALTDAALLLMDEPFSAIDAINRMTLQDYLVNTWLEEQRTVLYVTHDIEEAVYLADRIVILKPSPGRLAADICENRSAAPARSPFGRVSRREIANHAGDAASWRCPRVTARSASTRLKQLDPPQGPGAVGDASADRGAGADHGEVPAARRCSSAPAAWSAAIPGSPMSAPRR